jgi:hypothetical protein
MAASLYFSITGTRLLFLSLLLLSVAKKKENKTSRSQHLKSQAAPSIFSLVLITQNQEETLQLISLL